MMLALGRCFCDRAAQDGNCPRRELHQADGEKALEPQLFGGQPTHIACPSCDAWLTRPEQTLTHGQRLLCPRCGHVLLTEDVDGLAAAAALASTGLLMLLVSLQHPFLNLSAAGTVQTMDLIDSVTSLFATNQPILALVVLGFIVLAPLTLCAVLLTLTLWLHRGWFFAPDSPAPIWLAKVLHEIEHWNMMEVFVIGVLVSLTKMATLAEIELGLAFWTFIVFALCTLAAAHRVNEGALWRHIEKRRHIDPGRGGEGIRQAAGDKV